MTTEEKLQHFYAFSMESACREAEQILAEYQSTLDAQFAAHKESKQEEAARQLTDETNKAKREINKAISAEQLKIRRRISRKEKEIKHQLFDEVAAKLNAYKEDSAETYLELLCKKITEAKDFASGDKMTVYIDPSDATLVEPIEKETGITPAVSAESFLGGMRAVIHSKNILIDNSFSTLMQEARNNFTFYGGLGK